MPKIKGQKREKSIKIRVTAEEHEKLNNRKTNASLAVWLRNLGLGATPIHRADPILVQQIGRLGSNLNQIAKHVNTEKQLDMQCLQAIQQIEQYMKILIEDNINASKNKPTR